MATVKFRIVLLYFLLKYLILYILIMFIRQDYAFLRVDKLSSVGDWYYYMFMFLFLPIINMVLFSAVVYFSFRLKNFLTFVALIGLISVAEYLMYVFFTSQKYLDEYGVFNGIIGILLFLLLFHPQIKQVYKVSKRHQEI
ncbi:hypothetical protein DXN04_14365 [Chitinophaga silvisoli]|uniref:Uncharacterized protein n=1 Tax=Chitinophaga silvisoli TaxID=2291814 RepID=A0A3E1P383_9BACT|nr:hypothetical protein DXN04_14365 [Chitinophaga silvisoli]